MLAKRIIPCLDVTGGRVVKGVNFVELRDAGDPVEIAARYNEQGADELTFLDITATSDERDLILHIIEAVASQVFIPLTVGGGVRSGGRRAPAAERRRRQGQLQLRRGGRPGRHPRRHRTSTARSASSSRSTPSGARRRPAPRRRLGRLHPRRAHATPASTRCSGPRSMADAGAGEILLTSMDRDGTKIGFDLALTRAVVRRGAGAGDRVGRRRRAAASGRRHPHRRRRRGARGEHLPLRRVHRRAGQGADGARRHSPCAL